MILKIFVSGILDNNTMVIACEKMKKAAVIDPSAGSFEKVYSFAENQGLEIEAIFITHSHWDHVGDVTKLKEKTQAKVYIHKLDGETLKKPDDLLGSFKKVEGIEADFYLEDGDKIKIGQIEIEVIHTPGHTPGSICLYIPEEKVLFSGDTLFAGSMGNISFPTSNPLLMWKSLKRLSELSPEIEVYPGHGPKTSIGDEPWLDRAQEVFGY